MKRITILALSLILIANQAYARSEAYSNLQVSGGIALPATSTAVHANPAGIIAAHTAVVLSAEAPDMWSNGTYRAGLETGGSSFGVAGGIEDSTSSNNGRNSSSQNSLLAYYGLAVGNEAFTLGLAGRTGISKSSGSTFNAGLLFGVATNAKIGITAFGIDHGVDEWGAGVAFGVGTGVDLVLDAASDRNLDHLQIKPGIKVSGGSAALTLSYGTGSREQFADGFTAGASFNFSAGSVLEIQYNAGGALSKYYAGLTFGI